MKELPILFNGEMVRAILEGRKTETRRPVTPQPPIGIDELHGNDLRSRAPYDCECNETGQTIGYGFQDEDGRVYKCPFGCIGDRLWVRENFRHGTRNNSDGVIIYAADGEVREVFAEEGGDGDLCGIGKRINERVGMGPCHPSIHMPRWASRITLEVTDICVQRVQEISEEDAMAEGFSGAYQSAFCVAGEIVGPDGELPSDEFKAAWQSIYNTWDANHWVWVATFKKVEAAQ